MHPSSLEVFNLKKILAIFSFFGVTLFMYQYAYAIFYSEKIKREFSS